MSYATLLDALFAPDLADSTLEEESIPVAHPDEPTDEPELPEEPGELRHAAQPKATMRPAA